MPSRVATLILPLSLSLSQLFRFCCHSNSFQLSCKFDTEITQDTRESETKASTVRVESFRFSVFVFVFLKNPKNFAAAWGNPKRCVNVDTSSTSSSFPASLTKPNRRRQGNPQMRHPLLSTPLPTLPPCLPAHTHFKLELCVVNILRLQHQTLQITHGKESGCRGGGGYRKRK